MDIRTLLKKKIVICDGAMGTMLQKQPVPPGKHPELLNLTHPEVIEGIFTEYFDAGSDFVATNTFGANRYKLADSGHSVAEVVTAAVNVARRAADKAEKSTGRPRCVALDISPIGRIMEPTGDLTFEEAYDIYTEIIEAGSTAGADFLLFETYTDLAELRAGIIAAKEHSRLPIFATVTFQEDGRMLMGADPETVVNVLQDMGIDALGVNCSLGPRQMVPIAEQILAESHLPVIVQPNAGLPRIENGKTVFDVTIREYTEIMTQLVDKGVRVAGGCCGTDPDYIASLAQALNSRKPSEQIPLRKQRTMKVSSGTRTVTLDDQITVIGERINPTGKKALKEALKAKDYSYIENEALRQAEAGAHILDVNVGLPEINEKDMMTETVRRLSAITDIPLQIDSSDPAVLEAAVRIYNGKPIINSVNGKEAVMEAVFPIAKKYGANIIALTLDEDGLPDSTEKRLSIAEKIIDRAAAYGIGPERILVDCLTLTVSVEALAAGDTLSAIQKLKQRYPVKTTLGASNVSFGLPNRKLLNTSFLTAAMYAGLDAPITDPLVPQYMDAVRAFSALFGKDLGAASYIAHCSNTATADTASAVRRETDGGEDGGENPAEQLKEIIVKGWIERAAKITENVLLSREPLAVVEEIIIPALEEVGKRYETGRIFLPQLIRSADTVSASFSVLKQAMSAGGKQICYGKIILATVEGDIHDIGKNIVKVLLENYGYQVIDLGKDVPVATVLEAAKRENIRMVGLSALMTTTVVNMERTIQALRSAGLTCDIAVGGAVLTAGYAQKIGADHYCKDAMDTVRAANALFRK